MSCNKNTEKNAEDFAWDDSTLPLVGIWMNEWMKKNKKNKKKGAASGGGSGGGHWNFL